MTSLPDAVLADYVAFESYLLRGLEELLDAPSETPPGRRLTTVLLDLLLETFPRELGLGDAGGYLDDVLREHPHLAAEVELLRREHVALWGTLQSLRDRSAEELPPPERGEFRREVSAWREAVLSRRHHELRLLQEAGGPDVGGEG